LKCAGQGWKRSFEPWNKRSITLTGERNILYTVKDRKTHCTGHILHRNRLSKHFTKGKIEEKIKVTRRRGRRGKQPLDDLKEKRGYWKFEEEIIDRTLWRNRFCRGYGPVVIRAEKDELDTYVYYSTQFYHPKLNGCSGITIQNHVITKDVN
jgi:hypothetical protein